MILVSPAHFTLIDSSDLETAGWPVTLSSCKWGSLGPGGCPCGPAPCLVVLSADWLAGVWFFFMLCGPRAGRKTRSAGDDIRETSSENTRIAALTVKRFSLRNPLRSTYIQFCNKIDICWAVDCWYDSAECWRAWRGRRVLTAAVVTGRGRNPGGVGLNENTTRLVVCVFPCSYRHLVAILFLPIRESTFCSGLFKFAQLL